MRRPRPPGETARWRADAWHADPRLFIGAIAKCFQMLEALNTAHRPIGLTELARISGLGRSSAQRITHTLRALGYLKQDPANKTLRLSGRMLEFGYTMLSTDALRDRVSPHLEDLNRRTGETVSLMELEHDEIVYVARYLGRHAVSVDLHIGSRLPAFCTAAGRAILSQLDPADALARLRAAHRTAMTERTVTDLAALSRLLDEARQQGYALNDQEAFVGDISIAAPLLTADGKVLAAVNIAVLWPRRQLADVLTHLTPLLLRAAKAINRDIRFL